MDPEEIIEKIRNMDREELRLVVEAVRGQLRELGEDPEGGGGKPVSGVVEYRPHADGTLQKEVRRYYRKDGSVKEQGPYWYFRYHEGGRQKKLYLGKTDDPESELAKKRREGGR